jgi:PiT family inorganic phosphate transporter
VGGFFLALLLMVAVYRIFMRVRPALVRRVFGRAQLGSAAFMAFSHGANDAQKTMGIIVLAIELNKLSPGEPAPSSFDIPLWVIISAAAVMGSGRWLGGGELSAPSVCDLPSSSRYTVLRRRRERPR